MTPELAHSLDSIFPHIANLRRGAFNVLHEIANHKIKFTLISRKLDCTTGMLHVQFQTPVSDFPECTVYLDLI